MVRAGDPTLYAAVGRRFAAAPWVAVIQDRRRGARRQAGDAPPVERRLVDRRTDQADSVQPRTHRLSQRQPGVAVYELMDLEASTDCPRCGTTVWFEMPRFGEPPLRLQLQVDHEDVAPRHSRHVVALEAFGATGRSLVSFRAVARVGSTAP